MRIASFICVVVACSVAPAWAADLPKPLVAGMSNPESVCVGPDGAIYVTEIGEFGKTGDGQVSIIKDGKAVPLVQTGSWDYPWRAELSMSGSGAAVELIRVER